MHGCCFRLWYWRDTDLFLRNDTWEYVMDVCIVEFVVMDVRENRQMRVAKAESLLWSRAK